MIGFLVLHLPDAKRQSERNATILIAFVSAWTLGLVMDIVLISFKGANSATSGLILFVVKLGFILSSLWFLVVLHVRLKEDFLHLEDKFIKVFNTSPHGMAIVKVSDSTIIEVNTAFLTVSGYSADEVIGKTSIGQGMWHDPLQRSEMIAALLNYQSFGPVEYKFIPKTGKPTSFLLTAQLILIKGEKFLVAHFEEKADRASSGNEAVNILKQKLRETMSKEALYKIPRLTLSDLAEKLETNKTYLSQAINSEYGNFNEYLNKFRVIEACRLIQNGLDPRLSLDYLYSEVGFSSRTTFYEAFKKFTGVSPSRFLQINNPTGNLKDNPNI